MVHLGRAWMAIRRGLQHGVHVARTTYNPEHHIAELELEFPSYEARLARYWHNRRYRDNSIYTEITRYIDKYKVRESLYKHIRGLRNPVSRLVSIESSNVFGGAIDFQTFATGSIIIKGADDNLIGAIRTVLLDSNATAMKSLWVREGATMGDIALKIVDDIDQQQARIEVLDPRKVFSVEFDAVGNVQSIDIRYERQDKVDEPFYDYRETIDNERFRTYKDGELFAYTQDGAGQDVAEWSNPYGFVPVVWTEHINTGLGFGVTSFSNSRHKIDNLNDIATLIHDNVRKTVNTKYQVGGDQPPLQPDGSPSTITVTGDNRDISPVLYLGAGNEMKPIVSPLDIDAALNAVDSQQREIESDMPQLALQRIRETGGNLSGVAIRNLYADAINILEELQGNYSADLNTAILMAIAISGFRRYAGFEAYTINSVNDGSAAFQIKPRLLFADSLTKHERLEMTKVALETTAPELMLKQLDYDADEIEEATSSDKIEREMKALVLKSTLGVPNTQLQDEMGYTPEQIRAFGRTERINNALDIQNQASVNAPAIPVEEEVIVEPVIEPVIEEEVPA